jgi:anaerobic selenocysteine-containing dehydrogenase
VGGTSGSTPPGSCSLEEYYTLAVIGKAGIGTPHMDGNTRLCTATAASALKASFGTDGQPGSYSDVDHCDAIALWGRDVAATQTVLWMRMLDRRRGPNPPAMLAVDPRTTPVYQSNQATAASCQVNNLHLLRGMLGRPGAGLYQMNGQPTAQNTRETGADGDLPGLRNWDTSASWPGCGTSTR